MKVLAERQERRERQEIERQEKPQRDISRYLDGLRRVPFSQLDRPGVLHPSEPYEKLASVALQALNTNERRAVLCWPKLAPSPAAIVAMLMLGDCEACDPTTVSMHDRLVDSLTRPWGLRALIYPYARTAHRSLRHIYVDKDYLHKLHLKHQIRSSVKVEDVGFADFHKALARVHTLAAKTNDREFDNPCVDELLPSGPCSGAGGRSLLLWRIRTKIDIDDIKRSEAADDPRTAKFYLFGLSANENVEDRLKALKPPPNLILLQLDAVGRGRLGGSWESRIKSFLTTMEGRFGTVAVIAITDDPWTFDRIRFDALFTKPKKRKEPPYPSDVIFSTDSEIVTDKPQQPVEYAPIRDCSVQAYAGETEKLLRRLRSDRLEASKIGDQENVERLGRLIGVVRRCTSLPGSRAELGAYLEEERGAIFAAELMVRYRVGSLTKELRESFGPWPQLARAEVMSLSDAVQDVWDKTDILTPMKPLLHDIVAAYLNKSSRTIFLFPDDMLADFAVDVLTKDSQIGPTVRRKIDLGMMRFLDKYGLDDLASLSPQDRNQIKTLVVVAPGRAPMLDLLAKPWLPEKVIVLSDADTLESTSRDTDRLASYRELSPLKLRFEAFSAKAHEAATRVQGTAVNLDPRDEPPDDDVPLDRVVNLAGKVKGNQSLLRIELEGSGTGQVVIAKPASKLVLQDRSQALPIYKEVDAKDVAEGDRICVIGDAFVEMARPLINITRRAAEEIRDYHEEVVRRFAALPGDSEQARLRALVERMGLEGVTTGRARYWIRLEEQLQAPLGDVVASAPQDLPTFIAFMKALGLSGKIVERYWFWAVIEQRSLKLRDGMRIRDAYRGILVDSYSAQSDNPTRLQELRRLRAAAEDFVGVIRKIENIKAEHVGA